MRFTFKRRNHELPILLAGLPVFSPKWAGQRAFNEVIDTPIASGPYRIARTSREANEIASQVRIDLAYPPDVGAARVDRIVLYPASNAYARGVRGDQGPSAPAFPAIRAVGAAR